MAANKVILNGDTLVDLTQDTVIEEDVAEGKIFHKANGEQAVGTATFEVVDSVSALDELTITENGTYAIKDIKDKVPIKLKSKLTMQESSKMHGDVGGNYYYAVMACQGAVMGDMGPSEFVNISYFPTSGSDNVIVATKYKNGVGEWAYAYVTPNTFTEYNMEEGWYTYEAGGSTPWPPFLGDKTTKLNDTEVIVDFKLTAQFMGAPEDALEGFWAASEADFFSLFDPVNEAVKSVTVNVESDILSEDVTVALNMTNGDQVISPSEDKLLSKVTVTKPATMLPENIKEGVDIGGVVGAYAGGVNPQGEIVITSNNTYDVTNYSSARVEVAEPSTAANKLKKRIANAGLYDITPDDVGGSLSSIKSYAFYNDSNLRSIRFSESSGVGGPTDTDCLGGCTNLETLDVSACVNVDIGQRALSGCSKLHTIIFSENLRSIRISDYGMSGCKAIKSLDLSKMTSCQNATGYNFSGMTSLESVIWSDTLTTISKRAFNGCTSLVEFDFKNVTKLNEGAFSYCGFTELYLPDSITTLDANTFSSNTKLTSAHLPDSITTMGNSTFYNCSALISANIPDSVTSLGTYTFYGCYSLTSATIPVNDTITTLPSNTFYSCEALPNVFIPRNIQNIDSNAFANCKSLEYIDLTDYGIEDSYPRLTNKNAFDKCGINTESGTFEIHVQEGCKSKLSAMTNWSNYADNIVEVPISLPTI